MPRPVTAASPAVTSPARAFPAPAPSPGPAPASAGPAALAVYPDELRRAGSALAEQARPPTLPEPVVDAGWGSGAALRSVLAATDDCLAGIAAQAATLGDALSRAALAYERSDDDAARAFR